jgi:hypothetical protein
LFTRRLDSFRHGRQRVSQAISRRSSALVAAVADVIGPDEILLAAGLTLVTVALWPVMGRVALIVPGVVLLWIAIPEREQFVRRPPTESSGKGERKK